LSHLNTYIGGAKRLEVLAGGHHDHAQGCEGAHDGEALGTTPRVEDLGQGNEAGRSDGIGDDEDDVEQRVGFKVARDVGNQTVQDRTLERIDEVEQPDAARCQLVSSLEHP
jgi:hypothetical protein